MLHYEKEGHLQHVMLSHQFSISLMEELFDIADHVKEMTRKPNGIEFLKSLLCHKKAMLYFTQPSTRTFLSFLTACQMVGMDTGEVRDPSLSSEYKGESQEDGVRVFSSYFDMIIMRDPKPGFCEYMAYLLDNTGRSVPIMNGGSGKDQHPTQALLDLYTMHRSFQEYGGIRKKRYAFVGDLLRGRAVRSSVMLLSQYKEVEMDFIAPSSFQIATDLEEYLLSQCVKINKTDNLESVISKIDCIYMTRIQDEYDLSGESNLIDYSQYSLTPDNVNRMKKDSIILHPLPRRHEISPEVDADPRAMYWRQLRNGVYIRAALLLYVFNVAHRLKEY
ncbi:MAG: aspartate carbamoyltransferase [Deltaproteobacteria bacterium]|nr:aspartate carbamoyltransferase [Deltaproteobacteria bacterium]RZO47539.1 MAG: aspartate carbamoyltransferase [Pseudomonadota bacterium]HAF89745.1 aspartate carbamoyltransferase [Deltaproteobacteria bacterium]